jgi:peptidoglycan/LPS O-acetylase OafA/YrhL
VRAGALGASVRLRPEIQALRGVAVALVVVCHFWPAALPGGYVGVDVFFVSSGLLTTSGLLRELERDSRVSLSGFWARRARRILPAGLFVLAACAVATVAIVPATSWPQFLSEIRASALYVENWHLAASSVDYFAASDGPSPVRHYWSLSVEEQFYLAWPLVFVALGRRRRTLVAALAILALASCAYSIAFTAAEDGGALEAQSLGRIMRDVLGGDLGAGKAVAGRGGQGQEPASPVVEPDFDGIVTEIIARDAACLNFTHDELIKQQGIAT